MEFSSDFREWLDGMISDGLDDYKGTSEYGCDLAFKLFEGENVNGSVTCSTYEAKEFIKEHWDDAGEIAEYLKSEMDMTVNPFEEPEKFHVCMLLEGAREVLSESEFIQENWDNSFELDDASIAIIKDDLGIDTGLTDEQLEMVREKYTEDPEEAVEFAKGCNDSSLKVLLVKPGEVPQAVEIGKGLASLQAAVGGDIQAVYPFEDQVAIVCNEEGKINGMPLNRALYMEEGMSAPGMKTGDVYDILAGDFLVVGLSEDDFSSLPSELMEKYTEQFKAPETFTKVNDEIVVTKESVVDSPTSLADAAKDAREASAELDSGSVPMRDAPEL